VSRASADEWIKLKVTERWRGAQAGTITALRGDASTRRFWRVNLDSQFLQPEADTLPATAIAVDLGPDDLPLYARTLKLVPGPITEPPWLSLQRFLQTLNISVPAVFAADLDARMLLVEDVGEVALSDAATRGDAADLYRLAADTLLRFHLDGTQQLPPDCIAARVAYDQRLFHWELEQFAELGASTVATGVDFATLRSELNDLAARLGRYDRVFSHRDYHGQNLFVQLRGTEPVLRVIDFQDALMAPATQDLAVLLTTRDTSRIINERVEQRVLEYYYSGCQRRGHYMNYDEFLESYRLCVLQHALKVIGRFTYLEQQGKQGYAKYIPYAMAQARRMLSRNSDFPLLTAALRE
jgi:aminoglycoside/choline kinase family phosphotransferase